MKITKSQLKQIIKEELSSLMERSDPDVPSGPYERGRTEAPLKVQSQPGTADFDDEIIKGIQNILNRPGGLEDRISTLEQQMQNMFLKQK